MKELLNRPLLTSLLLALPLWLIFDNFVVGAVLGLLAGFFITMSVSLYRLKHPAKPPTRINHAMTPDSEETTIQTPAGLPALDTNSARHCQEVAAAIQTKLRQQPDHFMSFDTYMDQALYAPGLGYYVAGSQKFPNPEAPGDFTTAPELTPAYGQALARQIAEVLQRSESNQVLEFGAGSGALALSIIKALREMGIEPQYTIIEVSGELRERQGARLNILEADVQWRESLPRRFEGCVVANEVLDAMPVSVFRWNESGQLLEKGVTLGSPFSWAERPASKELAEIVHSRMPPLPGYTSEINLRAEAWVESLGQWLHKGAALIIDYGFPRHEYYHPQRAQGTLMCHFRHHAHAEPLVYPGLQDITAHVDFTAIADAALKAKLDVLGYTSQARFLINTGFVNQLAEMTKADALEQARTMASAQTLLSEAEMGELFKVMMVGRGIEPPLLGFQRGDRRDRL
jgi:SAM-dependent MidA family methyltransferase|tara:strand:- start:300961 stop:302334 length:1374 start_codon:yes stop_codon:yes gene_type:complete